MSRTAKRRRKARGKTPRQYRPHIKAKQKFAETYARLVVQTRDSDVERGK